MATIYDIIIAGGGIAGLYAARELSKAKLKVLLVDQTSTLGSTAWTPAITLEKFSLPKEGINAPFNEVIFGTLKKEKKWVSNQNIGYVLDYKRMSTLVLEEAKINGCIVLTQSTVNSLIKKNEEIVGINTTKGDFYGKYFIDATGSAGVLVSEIGLRKKVPCHPSVGMEIEIYDPDQHLKKFQNAISVFFDKDLFACGYGWVSTNGNNKYKIGIGESEVSSFKKHPNLELRLEEFIKLLLNDKKIEILEKHGGSIYGGHNFKVNSIRHKNLLGIGDTIGSFNPFLGEGIRHALYSSDMAVESILKNIQKGEDLDSYEKKWKKYTDFHWKLTSFINIALYEKNTQITQNFYNELIKIMDYLDVDDIIQIGQEYKIEVLLKKFPQNMNVIYALLRARFFNFG
ncbi:putative Lycopene beta and epsilon cyclase [Candidatus Roizmanbacteria bacterium]|nr:putative Lycopene beta and epsilon cyclase [Candidatus Roizmanbacteria bacterium]